MRFICAVLCAIVVSGCSRIIEARYPLTPLAKAARTGDIGEIDRLIAAGADVNAGSGVNAWPPLMHAVHKGQVRAVARLLERGASVDGDVGREALVMASGYGDAKSVALLLLRGVDPRGDGHAGARVMTAAVGGVWDIDYRWNGCDRHTAVVRSLLQRDAGLRLGTAPDAVAARRYAEGKGCTALVQMLGR